MFHSFQAGHLFISLAIALSLVQGCRPGRTSHIRVSGSTSIHPIMKAVSKVYMKENDVNITLRAEGSKTGIIDLIEKKTDIATSSSKMDPALRDMARAKGIKLKEFIFARDMVLAIVHPSNPVKALSLEQVKSIFSGSTKTWNEVGGASGEITVVVRDTDSGTREVWDHAVMEPNALLEGCDSLKSNSDVVAYVAKHPSAIGYISYDYLNPEIRAVSIDGVAPTPKTAATQKYPILRNLYLYVNGNAFSVDLKEFVIFLLGNKAQNIIKDNGFIPLYPLAVDE